MAKFDFVSVEPDQFKINELVRYCYDKPKLNLGCNIDVRPDFVNVDLLDIPDLDLRCDIVKLPEYFTTGMFEEILAYDLLEHFPFAESSKVLSQWVSWLSPGGKIIVRVPDMYKIAHALITGKLPAFEASRLLFGGQDYESNFHMAGFTGDVLEGLLRGVGCSEIVQVVREPETYNVTVVAIK